MPAANSMPARSCFNACLATAESSAPAKAKKVTGLKNEIAENGNKPDKTAPYKLLILEDYLASRIWIESEKHNTILKDLYVNDYYIEEISEKIRLLYVATTRAKNRLILIGNNKKNYKKLKTDYEIMSQNNYLSMIIGCLDDDVIQKINLGEEYDGILFNNLHLKLNIYKDIQLLTNQNNVQTPIFNDKENQQKLYDYLSYD